MRRRDRGRQRRLSSQTIRRAIPGRGVKHHLRIGPEADLQSDEVRQLSAIPKIGRL